MKKIRDSAGNGMVLRWMLLGVLFIGLTGATCTEEKDIEIVVTTEITAHFVADGQINVINDSVEINVTEEIDLDQILADNGYDEVKSGSVEGALYRVVEKDPVANRTISGTVGVGPSGGTGQTLIEYQSVAVNDPSLEEWTPVPLESGGVAVMNGAIANVIAGLPVNLTFTVDGTSTPQGQETNFAWDVKLRLKFIVTKNVEIIDPI